MKRWLARHPILRLALGLSLIALLAIPLLCINIFSGLYATLQLTFRDIGESTGWLWRVTFPRKEA